MGYHPTSIFLASATTSFGIGNMSQVNSMVSNVVTAGSSVGRENEEGFKMDLFGNRFYMRGSFDSV